MNDEKPSGFDSQAWEEGYCPCDDPPFPDGCRLELVRPGKVQCDCVGQGDECPDCGLPMFDDWFLAETGMIPESRAAHGVAVWFGSDRRCGERINDP